MNWPIVLVLAVVPAGCLPADDAPPPRWGYLHAAVIAPSCSTSGCHSGLTAIAGIDLSDKDAAYTLLTGRICGEPARPQDPPRNFVTPGSAEYSTLIYQLRGVDAVGRPYRDVMPPDVPLPAVEIGWIAEWIDRGAACD